MTAYVPSEAEVEAAAREIYGTGWAQMNPTVKDQIRADYRRIIAAAHTVAPCHPYDEVCRSGVPCRNHGGSVAPTPREDVAEQNPAQCVHCSRPRESHGRRGACIKDGYWGNRFTPSAYMVPAAALRELVDEWSDRTYLRDDGTSGRTKHSRAELAGSAAGLLRALRALLPTAARTAPTTEGAPDA